MLVANEKKFTDVERRTKKIELITKILNYPANKDMPIEDRVSTFDKLYDLPLEDLTIYYNVYK